MIIFMNDGRGSVAKMCNVLFIGIVSRQYYARLHGPYSALQSIAPQILSRWLIVFNVQPKMYRIFGHKNRQRYIRTNFYISLDLSSS